MDEHRTDMTGTLQSCRLFLLDMDGTLNLGDAPLPGAVAFVEYLRDSGRDFIYLTNNSSRAGADYVERMSGMGFPCTMENVFTSGMATGLYLQEKYPGRPVHLVGTRAFARELESYGVELAYTEESLVVVGFDRELDYAKLEKAVHLLRRGAAFIAANPDWVCPMPGDEALPDCGSICALLTAASGREPLYIGKPNRNMVDLLAKQRGLENRQIACVGDRLYTDIAVAQNAGAVSVLVLSGETTAEMLEKETRTQEASGQIDHVFADVAALAAWLSGSADGDDSPRK